MKSSRYLRILTGIITIIYFLLFILEPLISGEHSELRGSVAIVYFLFLLFLLGFAMSFRNESAAGITLILWLLLLWIFGFFVLPGSGLALIFSTPVIPVAVLFIRNGYLSNHTTIDDIKKRWEITLHLVTTTYAALYLIAAIYEITNPNNLDFSKAPGTIMIGALIIFVTSILFIRKNTLITGIGMIIWYALIISISTQYPEFTNRGPWRLFGIPILLQGFLYIYYHYKVALRK
jgi:hypothetical protein